MIFFAPAERGLEAGMVQVDSTVKDPRNTGADMRGRRIADRMMVGNYYGTGEVGSAPVKWMLTLVDKSTFEEPRLAVLTFGEPSAFGKNVDEVRQIIAGLKRAK
jgi:hypothetical protein